ncbi:IclR family transcriptional regulator [Pollutimonas nitritireducens]|uniref:IclR family transcriptional regulator n=1 Tax=Pollutimonas nitritireducens TaxID=2045209 RepID=A0A2N4UE49_9BURK|nr:IclR family transcriptional regulator [Pollutimonas nitritireducens]PLC53277.1 IclR family transcriptional regulator [Pollutimonas nitritireducens]
MRAVDRIFSVLDAFTPSQPKLTLQEISDRISLSKATTFRLVNSLYDAGYLVRLDDQKYCLSMKLIKLAGVVATGLSIRDIAHPIMVGIADQTGETISLNTAVGRERVCIDVVESSSRLMHIVNLGEHAPLYFGATGKVLLSNLSQDEQATVLKTLPADFPLTAKKLKAQLDEIHTQRYAVTRSERVIGSLAISVAIFDINDQGKFAITLTGPEERMKIQEERNLDLMLTAQREVSSKMGSSLFSPNLQ